MSYFIYNNTSANEIIGENLLIFSNSGVETQSNLTKDITKGETNSSRPIANHIATTYTDVANFTLFLCKESTKAFTEEQQTKIINWLTCPKTPKWLEIKESDGTTNARYRGLFTEVVYSANGAGIFGITLTFMADSPYDWSETKLHTVALAQTSVTGVTVEINVDTDYLDDYIYPLVEIKGKTKDAEIKIQNNYSNVVALNSSLVTNETAMIVKVPVANMNMKFNCQNCTAKDSTDNDINYSYIGWDTASNITWLKLQAGKNLISFYGQGEFKISYRIPQKKARIYF